jgi:hypothetical protein
MAKPSDSQVTQSLLKAQLLLLGRLLPTDAKDGQALRSLIGDLADLGLTQTEVGRILGVDQSTVSRSLKKGT